MQVFSIGVLFSAGNLMHVMHEIEVMHVSSIGILFNRKIEVMHIYSIGVLFRQECFYNN